MKFYQLVIAAIVCAGFSIQHADAKAKIPVGNRQVIHKVADLPDTDDYLIEKGAEKPRFGINKDDKRYQDQFMDLARLHEEFNIAWILPLWITKEPRLVGYNEANELYYELTDEQLNTIILANHLDKEKLMNPGFYTRYGGKLVGLLLIGLIIYGFLPSKPKTVVPQQV